MAKKKLLADMPEIAEALQEPVIQKNDPVAEAMMRLCAVREMVKDLKPNFAKNNQMRVMMFLKHIDEHAAALQSELSREDMAAIAREE